jgi:hypothetical protein
MQAIVTKYHGPTDKRGSRLSAKCQAGSMSVSYTFTNDDEQHHELAVQLATRLGWTDDSWIASGTLPNGDYCHVLVSSKIKGGNDAE